MSSTAVHFGAGNIGRGFVGLLLHQAGFQLVFADVAEALINALADSDSYQVREVGPQARTHVVDGYRAINSAQDPQAVVDAVATSDVVTTAVGVRILEFVAPLIAQGLMARPADQPPVAVMACENAISATDILAEHVARHYVGEDLAAKATFANTAVDRIVPNQDPAAGLNVTVEDYCEWAIEEPVFEGHPPTIPGAHFVPDLGPYIERKLFTVNTGHCATAWFGQAAGKEAIAEAIADDGVREKVVGVLGETAALVVAKHGFDAAEHQAYVDRILQRFANVALPDTVERVGRGPLRKLSRHDRFVGPAAELAERGMSADHLVEAMGAGLWFRNADDPEVAQLADILVRKDADEATVAITGLGADEPLYPAVRELIARYQSQ